MKFKIDRYNFIKFVIVLYVIVIAVILGVKWVALTAYQKQMQQRSDESAAASKPIDYSGQFKRLKSAVSKESKEFLGVAKERMAGENVARMSDLNAAIEGSLKTYFDADERRLRAAVQKSGLLPSGESAEPEFVKASAGPVNEQLNPRIRMLLVGVGSLIQTYNAQNAFGGDLAYEMDIDKTEFVSSGIVRTELAKILFPAGNEWKIDFDSSAASGDFLGGIELRGDREVAYNVALVLVGGSIQFIEQQAGQPKILSTDEVLLQIKGLLDSELAVAREQARLAVAG